MEQDTASETAVAEIDDRSALDRFAEVFTSPVSAQSGLGSARRGSIIGWGLVITAIVAAASALMVMLSPALAEGALNKRIESLEKARDDGKLSDKQYQQQMEAMDMLSPTAMALVSAASAAVFAPIFILILGLIGLIIVKILQRDQAAEVGFGHVLSVVLIAGMISLAGSIVSVVLKMATGNLNMDLSPIAFVDTDNMIVTFLLSLVNPFTIWYLIVLGIGTALLAGNSYAKGILAWVAVWVVGGGLIAAGVQALGSMFGG